MKLKPFNLEAALAGADVVTRNELKVSQLMRFDCDDLQSLYGVIDKCVRTWNDDGSYYIASESRLDLFMVAEIKHGWINIYDNRCTSILFDSKEEAIDSASKCLPTGCTWVDTILIEWEE